LGFAFTSSLAAKINDLGVIASFTHPSLILHSTPAQRLPADNTLRERVNVSNDILDLSLSNSLTDLAARIRSEHDAATGAMRRTLEHAMAAGDLLLEAKAQLKHGQWGPWLAEHCGVPYSTSALYMKLARRRAEIEQISNVRDLSLRGAVGLLTAADRPSADEREDKDDELPPIPLAPGEIEIPIDDVKFRRDLYPRSAVHPDMVARYSHFLRELPAIEVNQRHELIDGWHRLEAFRQAKSPTIRVRVTEVSSDLEHIKLAIKRNATHGEQLPLEVELLPADKYDTVSHLGVKGALELIAKKPNPLDEAEAAVEELEILVARLDDVTGMGAAPVLISIMEKAELLAKAAFEYRFRGERELGRLLQEEAEGRLREIDDDVTVVATKSARYDELSRRTAALLTRI
jgi:hypothetical protein